jgi:hypothetical protein
VAIDYDTVTPYDGIYLYDSGIIIVTEGYLGWQAVLNVLAGTSGLGENEAANIYAYGANKQMGILAALNAKAGTVDLDINAVCNAIAGTKGLEALHALNVAAGDQAP